MDLQNNENDCVCTRAEPCQKNCSCAKPLMSHGCLRCCRYGSEEQKKAMALRLVAQEKVYHAGMKVVELVDKDAPKEEIAAALEKARALRDAWAATKKPYFWPLED